jgi:hypothetical protein
MQRGTDMHDAAYKLWNADPTWIEQLTPGDRAHVKAYYDWLQSKACTIMEVQVSSKDYPDCFGTVDAIGHNWLCDFKTGKTEVSAVKNWQLAVYAFYTGNFFVFNTYYIYQPTTLKKPARVDAWCLDSEEMMAMYGKIEWALDAGHRTNDVPLIPGDHCEHCKAQAVCWKYKERHDDVWDC